MNFNDLNLIDGLQFIPVNADKIPTVKNWQNLETKHELSKSAGVGIVCGKLSGNLEVIDIDLKYDLTGKLFENYKRLVNEVDGDLLKKLVVQKTRSGGYHLIYRCAVIAGNCKLANRATTDDEKRQTYNEEYQAALKKNPDDSKAREVADKSSKSDKVRVLFETRGEGGYIMCFPSKGYEIVFGDYYAISEITPDERDTLHSIARQFNQVLDEVIVPAKAKIAKSKGASPFEDYNQRGDVVALLESHGWRIVTQKGAKTVFLRPGQTTSLSSGNFDGDKNWFSVFTTSTEFDPEKAYLPYAVYAVLECNKDFSNAAKRLYDLGFGERHEEKEKAPSTRVIQSRVNPEDDDYSFLATPADYEEYLHMVRTGTLPQGLSTGSPELDRHFLFKEGNLVMINGIDNVGKTKFIWWMLLISAIYHGWKGIIFSSENTVGSFYRAVIQFYWGKRLYGNFAMSDREYEVAKLFIEKHFLVIKAQEDLFNYKDIINMVKKLRKKYPELRYCMIDPYNSLKIDLSGFSKLNTHEYHYEALSEIKSYGQATKFGWFVNHHAVTAAARAKDAEKKYPVAPNKADTEGGQKVANKADDFLTVHRITQHPTEWMVTEVHVRKIKDTETGGRPTPIDIPVKFEMYAGGCAFIERLIEGGRPIDPIAEWHLRNEPKQQEIFDDKKVIKLPQIEIRKPYKDNDEDFDITAFDTKI